MHARLKASALFYAITVALLIGLVMGAMVLLTHFRNVRTERWLTHERVASNARSAAYAALYRATPDVGVVYLDLFGNGRDSAAVEVLAWGAMDLVRVRAWHGDQEATITAFAGRSFDDRLVLDLPRSAGPVHVCGDARIRGNVRVPQADVRRGHIEGRPYSGDRLVDGDVLRSSDTPPVLRDELAGRLERMCSGTLVQGQAFEQVAEGQGSVLINAQSGPLPLLSFTGPTHLKDLHLRGPLLIRCNDSLSLDAVNELDLVMIQAPFIAIDPDAEFSVQCFASKGILVGAGARLIFPSLLAVWRDDRLAEGMHITIDPDALVQGAVIAIDRSIRGREQGSVVIHPGAIVQGELYAEGSVQHQGELSGTLIARELILRTLSTVYHGHLLDGTLHPYEQGSPWGFGCTSVLNERKILQWGNLRHGKRIG